MTEVHIIPILKDNYAYILTNGPDFCAVIDPGETSPIIDALSAENLKPALILNTHHHGDHVAGNEELKSHYNRRIIAPAAEMHKIPAADEGLKGGDRIPFGNETIHLIDSIGHTSGGVMYHLPQSRMLFVGDTLFSMGCGRLFEGTPQQMFDTLQRIKTLPDDTRLYCGHEYTLANAAFALSLFPDNPFITERIETAKALRANNRPTIPTTLAEEKRTNPFLIAQTPEEFSRYRKSRDTF